MMNSKLQFLPERTTKPRESGINMVMDKGLSLRQSEDLIEVAADKVDLLKLGFGTSMVTPNLKEKVKLYRDAGIDVYCGGTLFEAFAIRNQLDDYKKYISDISLEMVEISDGSISMDHDRKCEIIADFSKSFRVISEVGSKDAKVEISSRNWIKWMQNELSSGSWKVIAEAREGGNIGICDSDGGVKSELIDDIVSQINQNEILWEAPQKNQQVWFINKFGANVNLGNIAPNEIIPLECLRLGLRSDTFNNFLI